MSRFNDIVKEQPTKNSFTAPLTYYRRQDTRRYSSPFLYTTTSTTAITTVQSTGATTSFTIMGR